jgi:ribosome-associated heat shock protein Hsp15
MHDERSTDDADRLRVDKWLWAARFYRTRTLAAAAVEAGQVRVGGERVKPARAVRAGDVVTIRKAGLEWNAEVTAVAERRGSATDAAKLYRESDASRKAREDEVARRRAAAAGVPQAAGRPTKRERRKLEDFLDEP